MAERRTPTGENRDGDGAGEGDTYGDAVQDDLVTTADDPMVDADGDGDDAASAVASADDDTEATRGWWERLGSVRVRITVAASLVTAVAVALAGWLLIRSVENTQTARIHGQIETRVNAVAERLAGGAELREAVSGVPFVEVNDENGDLLISNPLTLRYSDGGVSSVFIGGSSAATGIAGGGSLGTDPSVQELPPLDARGRLQVFDDRVGGGSPPGGTPDGRADTGGDGTSAGPGKSDFVVTAGAGAKPEVVSRQVDTAQFGTLTVTAIAPADEIARSVAAVTKALWLLLPALVAIVALVAWWLVGRALRPVEAIRLEAESIGGATIHRRLPEPASDDEIGRLARTMNAMLGRLDRSAKRQRQFVSDASHELRSPVAAIRTDLEVALHEGGLADWPTVARAVLAEEGRLETLLGDLLVLASDDESAATAPHAATVDMARLAVDEVARGRQVPVLLDLDPDPDVDSDVDPDADHDALIVEGVAARLDRALANLVDNAARHARSEVLVSVSRDRDRVRVTVDDDGPGIPVIDRERIFERFTRLDGSRARDRGGAGLGLAVVRSIATRHSGFVWAGSSPLGGARFTLDLPAARSYSFS